MESVIELLGQELNTLRAQLKEQNRTLSSEQESSTPGVTWKDRAQAAEGECLTSNMENERLRSQNVALQEENELLRESNLQDIGGDKKSLLLQYRVSHDRALEQLQIVTEEKEHIRQTKLQLDETHQEAQEKLHKAREKCKKAKCESEELQQALEIIHAELQDITQERDNALRNLKNIQDQPPAPEMPIKFDVSSFLKSVDFDSAAVKQPGFNTLQPISHEAQLVVPQHAKRLCCADGILHFNSAEIAWPSSERISGAVAITPSHRYNPRQNGGLGAWEGDTLKVDIGQMRDLFYKNANAWYYLGIFECVASHEMLLNEMPVLRPTVRDSLLSRSVIFPDLVPPFTCKMVPSMYNAGVLKIRCFGFRCVGFNHELYLALSASDKGGNGTTMPVANKRPSSGLGGKQKGAKKRKP